MLDALRHAGWSNYSLFLKPDGLLVGYLETDDFDRACAAMNSQDVNSRWQAEMAPFFEQVDGRAPDEGPVSYTHLDVYKRQRSSMATTKSTVKRFSSLPIPVSDSGLIGTASQRKTNGI